jgi:hypothetical protein
MLPAILGTSPYSRAEFFPHNGSPPVGLSYGFALKVFLVSYLPSLVSFFPNR